MSRIEMFVSLLGLHIVKKTVHGFHPQGSSIVFILEESHIAVHVWPENSYIHIDLVTCSKKTIRQLKVANLFKLCFLLRKGRVLKFHY